MNLNAVYCGFELQAQYLVLQPAVAVLTIAAFKKQQQNFGKFYVYTYYIMVNDLVLLTLHFYEFFII